MNFFHSQILNNCLDLLFFFNTFLTDFWTQNILLTTLLLYVNHKGVIKKYEENWNSIKLIKLIYHDNAVFNVRTHKHN